MILVRASFRCTRYMTQLRKQPNCLPETRTKRVIHLQDATMVYPQLSLLQLSRAENVQRLDDHGVRLSLCAAERTL
jgi:hypothetical protein